MSNDFRFLNNVAVTLAANIARDNEFVTPVKCPVVEWAKAEVERLKHGASSNIWMRLVVEDLEDIIRTLELAKELKTRK